MVVRPVFIDGNLNIQIFQRSLMRQTETQVLEENPLKQTKRGSRLASTFSFYIITCGLHLVETVERHVGVRVAVEVKHLLL